MVSDPTTDDLIRWSEDGDSFFGKLSSQNSLHQLNLFNLDSLLTLSLSPLVRSRSSISR